MRARGRSVRTLLWGLGLAWITGVAAVVPTLADQGAKGDLEIGPYVGYGFPDDYSGLNPKDDLLYGLRVGYFFTSRWSYEGSYQMFSSETDPPSPASSQDLDIESVRANMLFNFRPGTSIRPFVTFGAGLEIIDAESFEQDDLGANVGAGVRCFFTERFGLRLDGRYVWTDVGDVVDDPQSNVEATLGLLWSFGGGPPADEDGDGVPDKKDDCPGTPQGATVDERGCPMDTDGDGVFDGLDKCPGTERGLAVDSAGCPKDSDGDGVNDAHDKCPGTPKGVPVDASGCPKDTDGDGVDDGRDKCPGTPKGVPVDATGCPKDSDGDGVDDGRDKCPGTAAGVKVDASGCPIPEPKPPLETPLVLEGVSFKTGSTELSPAAEAILDQVADSLRAHADVSVDIAGHTDSVGSEAFNLKLSQGRAESVLRHLVSRGVAASRLTAKGFGEANPVADNATQEGRARNRRVELSRRE